MGHHAHLTLVKSATYQYYLEFFKLKLRWNLTLAQVADLLRHECDDLYQLLTFDTRAIDAAAMEDVGQNIPQYRQLIRQDLPFRLKRLHVWNVSGWTPTQAGNDPKLRLVKRLLHTGPVSLQETRWHTETSQILFHNIPGVQVALFFSVQRLHGFRQVVKHALWHCKSSNFKLELEAICY